MYKSQNEMIDFHKTGIPYKPLCRWWFWVQNRWFEDCLLTCLSDSLINSRCYFCEWLEAYKNFPAQALKKGNKKLCIFA